MATAAQLIREAAARIEHLGADSPRLDAEVLLRHVLQVDRTNLFLRMQESVSAEKADEFARLVEKRLTGASVAYVVGQREFMGLPFQVGPGVLVPRPETEMLVEWAQALFRHRDPRLVVDVGTGSGAIILSLASSLPPEGSRIMVGCDISDVALGYAQQNKKALGLSGGVELVQGDLLEWLGTPADLILANLPYLRPDQVVDNPEIQSEPELALISGSDGFSAIARLIADLPRTLSPGGAAIFELDPDQAERAASAIRAEAGGFSSTVITDLSGRPRFVVAERTATHTLS